MSEPQHDNKGEVDIDQLLEYAGELTDPRGPLRGETVDIKRVKDLATWIGDAAGEPRDVDTGADLELTAEGDPEDTIWTKHAPVSTAEIQSSGLVHQIYGHRDGEHATARVETMPAGGHSVSLSVNFEAAVNDVELTHGGIAVFTPGQAEALAAALVEIAAEAREHQTDE